jgi:hypothetical protein
MQSSKGTGWLEALALVARWLADMSEPWCLGASGALALHGLPVTPQDVDLFTTPAGVEQIAGLLAAHVRQPPRWWDSELGRSRFAVLEVRGVTVEVIGDLRLRLPDGGLAAEPRALECIWLRLPGTTLEVPVSPLPLLLDSYRQTQRPARVAQIEAFLAQEAR